MKIAAADVSEAEAPLPDAAVAQAPTKPAPKSLADAWRQVGLSFEQASEAITDTACAETQAYFLACVHAVQSVLAEAETGKTLSALGEAVGPTFGPARVVADLDEDASWDARGARLRAEIAAWAAVFAKGDRVPWGELLGWLKKELVTPDNESALTAAATTGFLATFKDPYYRLVPTAWDNRERESSGTEIVGVGIYVEAREGGLVVTGVIPEGPAAEAGVKVGDRLVEVDGVAVATLDAEAVLGKVRGPPGTTVTLGLERAGERLTLTLKRARIQQEHVRPALLHVPLDGDRDAKVGFVRIPTFYSTHICAQVERALRAQAKDGARGFVIDVRHNGGGLVDQVRCLADLFLPPGRLIAWLDRDNKESVQYRTETQPSLAQPVVVLVDPLTVSAAEIFAGALQAQGRAIVMGRRTYGKGTIQLPFPYGDAGNITVYFTAGRYFVREGRSIDLLGVVPDVALEDLDERARDEARPEGWHRVELDYLEALVLPEGQGGSAGEEAKTRKAASETLRACIDRTMAKAQGWKAVAPDRTEALGGPVAAAAAAVVCAER